MPAPTNISAATALDLGQWPISHTQDVNFGGTTYTVWYTITPDSDGMRNLFAWGGGGDYQAEATLYDSDGTTPIYNLQSTVDLPWQFPAVSGHQIYLKVASHAGNVAAATLTITGALPPTDTVRVGDLLVTDDFRGHADLGLPSLYAAILSPDDGALRRFLPMVAGEFGDAIPDGSGGFIYALSNDDEDPPSGDFELVYYDTNLTETSRPYTYTSTPRGVRGNGTDTFYLADALTTVKAINRAGTVTGTWTMTGTVNCLAPSRDDSILYWATNGVGNPIKRWDLINDTALSDLTTAPAGFGPVHDILVLANGHILATWFKSGSDPQVIEYQADGTPVRTYTLTVPSTRFADGPRLSVNAEDDGAAFWAWLSGDDGDPTFPTFTGRFTKFSTSDGSTLTTFDVTEFEEARGPAGLTSDWPTFGNSKSCPLITVRQSATLITITNIPPFDCGDAQAVQTVTIHGANFGANPTVTVTDPNGDPVSFTITSHTTTKIVGTMVVAVCGAWTFTVCDGSSCATFEADTGTTFIMRRVRRFMLPFDQNYRVFISRLELLAQTGVGLTTGQGSDPIVMLRFSPDGGATWGPERHMSIGKIGKYLTRVFATRFSAARQPVAEIAVSDPVFLSFLECYVDAEKGTS